MKRRTALKIVTLSALSPSLESFGAAVCPPSDNTAWSAGDYKLQFFTAEENELLDRLMEMIIPADPHSPGAHAASVSLFADLMVGTGNKEVQRIWRRGLKLMQDQATQSSLEGVIAMSAANESNPGTELERFFVVLKRMTVDGYYTSAIGIHQDLQYQGNTYLNAYPGCRLSGLMRG